MAPRAAKAPSGILVSPDIHQPASASDFEREAEQQRADALHALKVRVFLLRNAGRRGRDDLELTMLRGLQQKRGRELGERMFDETLRMADFRADTPREAWVEKKIDAWCEEIRIERIRAAQKKDPG